ncbi:MAG: PilZ domain-containing protein [Hoeflea sp.]|uniref:PilZ domain-containing protein n=1 Tax=Hoeflea sp. TaxID=1940281 RepID=UPI0032EE4F3B
MSQDIDHEPHYSGPATEPASETGEVAPRALRVRVLKGAHAAFNKEFSAIPCTVRDLSETGAKIEFEGGWFVPEQFTLHVDIDGYKVECRRLWHRGRFCGVEFTSEKIRTGKARQQVIAPDTEFDKAIGEAAENLRQMGLRMGAFPDDPLPVRRTASRAAGFGRRTR